MVEGGAHRVHVDPVVLHRYRHDLGAVAPKRDQATVVRRVLHHRRAAFAGEQMLDHDPDALQRAVEQHHPLGCDPVAPADPLPQPEVPAGP